jgi:hypothetical protein
MTERTVESILLGCLGLWSRCCGLGTRRRPASTDLATGFPLQRFGVLLDGAELPLESSFGRAEVLGCLLQIDLDHDG